MNQAEQIAALKALFAQNAFRWQKANLFGILDPSDQHKDVWNDVIGIVSDDDLRWWLGTCNPSVYWTKQATAEWGVAGAAHMCLGQYTDAYAFGQHRGYDAIVQVGEIGIWRDVDKDHGAGEGRIVTDMGIFAINIHKGSGGKIGKHSAGCQVIRDTGSEWADFYKYARATLLTRRFDYTLLGRGEAGELFDSLYDAVKM